MKKVWTLSLTILTLLCVIACSQEKPHVVVARKFAQSFYSFEYKKAEAFCTPNGAEFVRFIAMMTKDPVLEARKANPIELDLLSDSLYNDNSAAQVRFKVKNGAININADGTVTSIADSEEVVMLVKEGKDWKVELKK